jgi:hypothetical protein
MIKEQKVKTDPTKMDKMDKRTILPQVSISQTAFLMFSKNQY